MLYIPLPFKRCSKCKSWLLPTTTYFPRNRSKRDGLSTECHECNRKRVRGWSENHPEQVADGKKLYAKRHPDRRKASTRRYWLTHHDRAKDSQHRYYHKNLESNRRKSNERAKDYYRRNKAAILPKKREQARRWREENPDWYSRDPKKYKTYVMRRAARRRSLPDMFTTDHWTAALDYFNGCCAVCGRPPGFWHTLAADHWIPLTSPNCPGTVPTNIVPLCHGEGGCNNSKSDSDPVEWLTEKFGPRKAKQILKRIQEYFDTVRKT